VSIRGGYAAIFINGERKTEGSAWADSVPTGRVTVHIERTGYRTLTQTISSLRPGQSRTVTFTMRAATP
jgi:hypothetical protein